MTPARTHMTEQRAILRAAATLSVLVMLAAPARGQVGTNTVDWGAEPLPISRVGAAGWQFLKLPTDARSASIGGIKSAVGHGNANSAFSNPASTVDVTDLDVQVSTMNWVADIKCNNLALVKNLGDWGNVGFSCTYVNYGDMIRTAVAPGVDALGNDIGIVPITDGLGTFTAHDLAAGITYGRQITQSLQIGGSLRYTEQQIDDARMTSWALDIGTMYWTGLGSLRISMLGRNFGPDGEFLQYQGRIAQPPALVKMPMVFLLGTAYDVLQSTGADSQRLTVAAEYMKPNDGPDKVHVGVEYFLFSNIYLRGGYRFHYDEESYTFGFGLEYAVDDEIVVKMDYGYANVGRFNSVHLITLGFGLTSPPR
jgi:hypothetical protein